MSSRFDNKRLLYILAALIVILAFTVLIKIPKERATLKDRIVEFDTTEVSKIILNPKNSIDKPYEFIRENGKWKVIQGNIISPSRQMEVENILGEILSIKPQNLVSKSKAKWSDFEVTDSTGTRIRILNKKGKSLADLIIGRFTYKQMQNQLTMYGRNNIQGTSYVRVHGQNEVFGVDGFLSLSFNRSFNDWRDNTLVTFTMNEVTYIKYIYPADSSFALSLRDSKWFIANEPADSAKVASFLTSLSNVDGQDFNDAFKPDINPDYQMIIEGNNLLNISIKGYRQNDGNYILNSSLNPGIYFSSNPEGIFKRVFKSKKDLF
ncbi:MAG TPA: DUF4340 domain-containing protein [Bacteroidales bacterium]|nr:DUF4340 domain-containing protein [Bacteroidales bacterium]